MGFFVIVISAVTYVVASLIDAKINRIPPYDMDKLLHRGKYAVKDEHAELNVSTSKLYKILRITKAFTKKDKIIYFGVLAWSMIWFAVFAVGTVYNLLVDTGDAGWILYWKIAMWITFVTGAFVTVWLAVGGVFDMKDLFRRLQMAKRNDLDDGMVIDRRSTGEEDVLTS